MNLLKPNYARFSVDASVDRVSGRAGIGGVLVDGSGIQWLSFYKAIGVSEPLHTEFQAIIEALELL